MAEHSAIPPVTDYATQVLAVVDAELRKLRHDPMELLSRAVQPALWLVLFGQVMAQVRGLSAGMNYLDFMAPGILSQSVLFIAIFYGISIIWERDLGIWNSFLVSPTPRTALVLGKALSAGGPRGLTQAVIVYLLALALGVHAVMELAPACAHRRAGCRHRLGCGFLLHVLARHRLPREDAGSVSWASARS